MKFEKIAFCIGVVDTYPLGNMAILFNLTVHWEQIKIPGPASLWPVHKIKNTSADTDTIFIRPEWWSEEPYVLILIHTQ